MVNTSKLTLSKLLVVNSPYVLNKPAYIHGDQSLINLSMGVVNSDTSDTVRQSQKKKWVWKKGKRGWRWALGCVQVLVDKFLTL